MVFMQENVPVPWILWVSRCMVIYIYMYQHLPVWVPIQPEGMLSIDTLKGNHLPPEMEGFYLYICNYCTFLKELSINGFGEYFEGLYTLQGTNISPKNGIFEDDFPFPKVGYVNPLEGIAIFCKHSLADLETPILELDPWIASSNPRPHRLRRKTTHWLVHETISSIRFIIKFIHMVTYHQINSETFQTLVYESMKH